MTPPNRPPFEEEEEGEAEKEGPSHREYWDKRGGTQRLCRVYDLNPVTVTRPNVLVTFEYLVDMTNR